MGLVSGKVALVTGAAAGIGRAAALKFASEGATVLVADVNSDGGNETVALIRQDGGYAVFAEADITVASDVEGLMTAAIVSFGRLDCACNNAGIGGKYATIADQSEENFDSVMAVNTRGTFLCLKYEISCMLKNGGGAIVNVASVAGTVGVSGLAPYVASKHAINGLTKTAALEYSKCGIRVNSISPGGIETQMLDSLARYSRDREPRTREAMDALHPIGRIGKPDEVAEVIVWLCSARSSFVTGANIAVDGGYVAQ